MKKFDLNIEKILENWEVHHAVREIIANAIDEQKITSTPEIKIFKDDDHRWHIRDFGRGIIIEHFTQNENEEKLNAEGIIGKFGIGLKDALATFDRKKIDIKIISKNGEFTTGKSIKVDFDGIVTLHIYLNPSPDPSFIGTEFIISNIDDNDIQKAKEMFLVFSGDEEIEKNSYGTVLSKKSDFSKIYINGVKVAEEENFLFSYNITNLNTAIKKALNRERTNVGRTAYSDRIKSILLSCNSWIIANTLINDLENYSSGKKHDELNWIDVQEHATKIYSKVEKVVFVTSNELERSSDIIEEAKETGHKLVVIPENLKEKVQGASTEKTTLISEKEVAEKPQLINELEESGHNVIIVPEDVKEKSKLIEINSGNTVNDFSYYVNQRNQNFEFKFVNPSLLNQIEKQNYNLLDKILGLIGGKPSNVNKILISETMQRDDFSFRTAEGIHQGDQIVIKRSVLSDTKRFISVLLHEIAHAKSGSTDATRAFEEELTNMLGIIGSKAIVATGETEKSFLSKLFR